MKPPILSFLPVLVLASALPLSAEPEIVIGKSAGGFAFEKIPAPALDDAAAKATLSILDGERDGNGGEAAVLVDGQLPSGNDEPRANLFFAPGTDGGMLRMDFEKAIEVGSVATYSWHRTTRGPQVYALYGATGEEDGFKAEPTREDDLAKSGWELLAEVDTREVRGDGDQHAALIAPQKGESLGSFRYLLFDFRRTGDEDAFGNTFYSEIDVLDSKAEAPERFKAPERVVKTFKTKDGKYEFTVDATKAPELMDWVEKELIPECEEWYPKMVEMMPSEGFTAADKIFMEFKDDMGGTPAYASGNRLSLSVPFFRGQLEGEAKGCVIHELVHTIQDYWRARRTNRNPTRTPGWITEGTADYVRWFLYEPEKKGAEITRRNVDRAKYDASYRTSAIFLDWVVRKHDKDLLQKLNAAAREGRYKDELWKEWTGKTVEELGEDWLKEHKERLAVEG